MEAEKKVSEKIENHVFQGKLPGTGIHSYREKPEGSKEKAPKIEGGNHLPLDWTSILLKAPTWAAPLLCASEGWPGRNTLENTGHWSGKYDYTFVVKLQRKDIRARTR